MRTRGLFTVNFRHLDALASKVGTDFFLACLAVPGFASDRVLRGWGGELCRRSDSRWIDEADAAELRAGIIAGEALLRANASDGTPLVRGVSRPRLTEGIEAMAKKFASSGDSASIQGLVGKDAGAVLRSVAGGAGGAAPTLPPEARQALVDTLTRVRDDPSAFLNGEAKITAEVTAGLERALDAAIDSTKKLYSAKP